MSELIEFIDGAMRVNFHPGQIQAWDSQKRFVCVFSGTQGGKALDIDTLIPTPRGFVPMGDLKVGDTVFDEAGERCEVTYVSPVFHGKKCYRVTFEDGTSVVADADHSWVTQTYKQRKNEARRTPAEAMKRKSPSSSTELYSQVTTKEIKDTLLDRRGAANHSIGICKALKTRKVKLPIDPYVLGVWLGDGTANCGFITTPDQEILDNIAAAGENVGEGKENNSGKAKGYRIGGRSHADRIANCRNAKGQFPSNDGSLQSRLRHMGLLGNASKNKRIPDEYMWASEAQRFALLNGLMDTDGTYGHRCEFDNSNERLANDVMQLIRSLGLKARKHSKIPKFNGKEYGRSYRITFCTSLPVFRLTKKKKRLPSKNRPDTKRHFVMSVAPVKSRPVKCIAVSSHSHQYLCSESFIPTHNTTFGPPWLWREIKRRGPGDYMVVTPTFPLLDMKALPTFRKLFEQTLKLGEFIGYRRKFVFSDYGKKCIFGPDADLNEETVVMFGHASDSESLESATAKAVWLDECGQNKFRLASWEAIQRRLSVHEGRALLTTTPYNLGWIKQRLWDPWEASGRNHQDIDIIRFDSTENPAFPPNEFERARRELPLWRFNMFYRAIFTRPAGLIYDCFDPKIHKRPRITIPKTWATYLGLDFGGVNTAGIFIAERPEDKTLWAYREYRLHDGATRTARQHVEAILAGEHKIPICVGGAGSEQHWREEFRQAGLPVQEPEVMDSTASSRNASSVEVGISRVYSAINTGQLFFFDDLSGILDELESYSRKTNEKGEVSDEIEDKASFHGMDSLRYIIGHIRKPMDARWQIGIPPKGKGGLMANVPKGVFTDRAGPEDSSFDKKLHKKVRKGATFDDINW